MKCPNCLHENSDKDKFCQSCGTKLNAEAKAPAAPQSAQSNPSSEAKKDVSNQVNAGGNKNAAAFAGSTLAQEAFKNNSYAQGNQQAPNAQGKQPAPNAQGKQPAPNAQGNQQSANAQGSQQGRMNMQNTYGQQRQNQPNQPSGQNMYQQQGPGSTGQQGVNQFNQGQQRPGQQGVNQFNQGQQRPGQQGPNQFNQGQQRPGQQGPNQFNQGQQRPGQQGPNQFNQGQQRPGQMQAGQNQPPNQGKKKSKVLPIILIALGVIAALVLGIFLISALLNSGKPPKMDDENFLKLLQENTSAITDGYEDVPIVEAKYNDTEVTKIGSYESYVFDGSIVRENDEIRTEGDYEVQSEWDKKNKKWKVTYAFVNPSTLKAVPKTSVSEDEIKDIVENLSIKTDKGNSWYADEDNIESFEIANRKKDDTGIREQVDVELTLGNVTTEVLAEVQLFFDWSYGRWSEDYAARKIISATEGPKEGAAFYIDEETIYQLWAGEVLDLSPYADTGIFVYATIPADNPKSVMSNARVLATEESYNPGEWTAQYSFDLNFGEWFSTTWKIEQDFIYSEEDSTYYLNDEGYHKYNFIVNTADISGEWYGTYTTDKNEEYYVHLDLKALEQKKHQYEGVVTIMSKDGKTQDGSYTVTAELNETSLRVSIYSGAWVKESKDFYRFSFYGYLIPDGQLLQGKSSTSFSLGKDVVEEIQKRMKGETTNTTTAAETTTAAKTTTAATTAAETKETTKAA